MSAPKKAKVAGIYAITHVTSGRRYIGRSKDIENRWRIHLNELRNGEHHSIYLQRVWDKEGLEAFVFEMLEYVEGDGTELLRTLIARERYHLEERLKERDSWEFNIAKSAEGPVGVVRSPELRQQWSEKRKGRPWSPERRAKYRYTEAMRAASAARKGRPLNEKQYTAITTVTPGRLAHVMKLVELQTGRSASPQRKANISKAHRERAKRLEEAGLLSQHPDALRARKLKAKKRALAEQQSVLFAGE